MKVTGACFYDSWCCSFLMLLIIVPGRNHRLIFFTKHLALDGFDFSSAITAATCVNSRPSLPWHLSLNQSLCGYSKYVNGDLYTICVVILVSDYQALCSYGCSLRVYIGSGGSWHAT